MIDITTLHTFYQRPIGQRVAEELRTKIQNHWPHITALRLLSIGYTAPLIAELHNDAECALTLVPSSLGVSTKDQGAIALYDGTHLPLPDQCMDYILIAHSLENARDPSHFLSEASRVLAPAGRLLIIAPSALGAWSKDWRKNSSKSSKNPFSAGQSFHKTQIAQWLSDCALTHVQTSEALHWPPLENKAIFAVGQWLNQAGKMAHVLPAGVYLVEARKDLANPVLLRPRRRLQPSYRPALG